MWLNLYNWSNLNHSQHQQNTFICFRLIKASQNLLQDLKKSINCVMSCPIGCITGAHDNDINYSFIRLSRNSIMAMEKVLSWRMWMDLLHQWSQTKHLKTKLVLSLSNLWKKEITLLFAGWHHIEMTYSVLHPFAAPYIPNIKQVFTFLGSKATW